ncbi:MULTISPECIES: three-helix bundle dimerization domain-containing protein [unclassified Rhodococcus (in: high G+C Gram-positive bacteria)]|uniref:three-helix bundle dimerization domain-containing protein n=1 Tax=unclassified Rhodococcus (in: high G+C Gram-positive bacteria) TaxID=192944 RepID=UPI0016397B5A|nr:MULTISPECIES: hypothetical protein [unclassified Rhodococcus (in: high G+C Gram-positive bacteria)]MBC2641186.1 hypothetical protein [Rhodococcus sp. 3A]
MKRTVHTRGTRRLAVSLVYPSAVCVPDAVPHQTVEQIVHQAHTEFAAGTVRDFVPLLVERAAQRKIAALAGS